MNILEINQRIVQLPSSMLEAENVKNTVIEAANLMDIYHALTPAEKEMIFHIDKVVKLLDGNSSSLDPAHVIKEDSPLKGKIIGYLGSSITVGMKSGNVAFPDYIAAQTGSTAVKQAISGGTLACKKSDGQHDYRERISYVAQLLDPDGILQKTDSLDALLVQLSTNDGTMDIAMGEITNDKKLDSFNISTVAGAIEYIIAYAERKWHCPVMFYINPSIHQEEYIMYNYQTQQEIYQNLVVNYQKMIDVLYLVQKKWQIGVIDLWNEPSFQNIDLRLKQYYMADMIHPYKSGYLFWYTPWIRSYMEDHLH